MKALLLVGVALWAFWTYALPKVDVPYVPDFLIPGASCESVPQRPGGVDEAVSDAGVLFAKAASPDTDIRPVAIRDRLVSVVTRAGELAGTFQRAVNGQPYQPPPTVPVGVPTPASGPLLAARAAATAGWLGEDLVTAVAIVGPESGYDPAAANPSSSARGLWQIMVSVHGDKIGGGDVLDPYVNARVAYAVWQEAGGFDRPWATTYGVGAHLPYMDEARAAVASLPGTGVIPAGYDPAGAGCEPGVIPAGMPPTACPAPESQLTATTIRACRIVAPAFGVDTVYGWGLRGNATEHDDGRALDFMTYTDRAKGQAIADYLVANARELRVYYVMFDHRIWNTQRADEGWRTVSDRGGTTANHEDHVHLSLLAEGGVTA